MEARLGELEDFTNHHEMEAHVKFSESLWAILDENGSTIEYTVEEEFSSGAGI
jgi:hypothetical protein